MNAALHPVCAHCGTQAPSRSHTPGTIWIEMVLWLCLIVPGLVYSFWRLGARKRICAACGSGDLVPSRSPRGKQLLAEMEEVAP